MKVQPLGFWAKFANILMIPMMYVVSGNLFESPQRTHMWNNTKLTFSEVYELVDAKKLFFCGVESSRRWISVLPIFHIPILGGWKTYVVLQPSENVEWYVGWISKDVSGVSRIRLRGPVRLLLGPSDVSFFGINAEGRQINILKKGVGTIGEGGVFSRTPFL